MAYIINTDNRQLIDAGENQLSYTERPNIIYGDGGVLSFDLMSGGKPLECSASDTWELYADTDYIHTTDNGLLANGYSGAVTSIVVTGLTKTIESTGFLILQNSTGERDRIAYSAHSLGTFTVDDTLENIFLAGDSVMIEDQLVLYSGNASFNNSIDREDVNVLTGKICVRYDALTHGFLNKITAPNTRVHIEIWRYISGQPRPQKVLQDDIYCSPTIGTLEGAPSTNDPVYYTAAQTLSLLNAGYEIELSDDGITWYELTFDELEQPVMPDTARWWHYRNALTAGTWSETIPLIVGPKGEDGADGADGVGFSPDAIGLLSGLSTYDDEPAGFSYLASDTGDVYFKLSATTGDWSGAIPFQGSKGDDGTSSYTYIAYASDNAGTGFSLTPSELLPYRAEIVSATAITTPTLSDFSTATWVKYIGEDGSDGADGADGAPFVYDDFTTEQLALLVGPQGDQGEQGPKGDKGDQGPQGPAGADGVDGIDGTSFEVTETGLLAGLSAYDAELKGFTYLATDTGALYIKQSDTSGDWSSPIPFQGPQGPAGADGADGANGADGVDGEDGVDGTSSYTYIAYASDNTGTDFNLTPSALLPYRAEIVSATIIATPTLTDFAGATWVKYIGEDGADGASITSAAFVGDDLVFTKDDTTTVTLTDAAITLKGADGTNSTFGGCENYRTVTSGVFSFDGLPGIYRYAPSTSGTLTFDITGLPTCDVFDAELRIVQPATPVTLTFPSGIVYLEGAAPNMSTGSKTYKLVVRYEAGTWYLNDITGGL